MGKAMVQYPIAGLREEETPLKNGDEVVEKREILKKVEPWKGGKRRTWLTYARPVMKLNVSLKTYEARPTHLRSWVFLPSFVGYHRIRYILPYRAFE